MQTTGNGYNYIIVKSGVAHGTDLHGNILKRNLITHLYTVTQVTSEFSGGIFTQRLILNRITDADNLSSSIKEVGPEKVEETDDKNDDSHITGFEDLERFLILDLQENFEYLNIENADGGGRGDITITKNIP